MAKSARELCEEAMQLDPKERATLMRLLVRHGRRDRESCPTTGSGRDCAPPLNRSVSLQETTITLEEEVQRRSTEATVSPHCLDPLPPCYQAARKSHVNARW
jgi:hypothetical protein